MVDITVIGAGLSGLYAAKEAALNGANVTVYEKRSKIATELNEKEHLKCGELFTNIYGMPPEACILNSIDTLSLNHDKLGNITVNMPKNVMVMTDRALHEAIIFEQCIELGVIFKFDTVFNSGNESFNIINATGFHNDCPSSGMEYAVAICYVIDTTCENLFNKNTAYLYTTNDLQGYYWWFPKGTNKANIGGGYHIYDLVNDNLKSQIPCDFESICNAIKSDNLVITINAPLLSGGGKIPFNMNYIGANYSVNGGIAVGDAAGLVNPLLMGGEHLAVLSGKFGGLLLAKGDAKTSKQFYEIQKVYYNALIDIIAPEMELGIYLTKMRDVLTVNEYWNFVKSLTGTINNIFEKQIIDVTKARMSKYFSVPESTDNELKQLIGE